MKNKIFTFLLILACSTNLSFGQNVGINATGTAPNTSAMLDVESTTRGLLIPRVSLTAINNNAPIGASVATSLLVYNTNTAGTGATAVSPGYYYWDGSKWVALVGPNGKDWALEGNAGTTASTNFIGTTDAVDLQFRTNNTNRMRIMNSTYPTVGIGTTAPVVNLSGNSSVLHVHDGGTSFGSQLILSTHSTADGQRTGLINFAATQATNDRRSASIESYLTAASGTNVSGDLRFFTNNANTFAERMRIISSGVVGIGTTNPSISNNGSSAVDKLNIVSSSAAAGVPLVEITNTGATGLSTVASNNNNTNSFNSLVGLSFYNGNTFLPSAVLGQMTTTNGSGTGHGVRGDGFSSTHIGVRGVIPTTGAWTGFGGLFTGGLAYANGLYNVSDKRLKKDIKPISNAIETIMKIKGVSYRYDSDIFLSSKGDTKEYLGFIAQDIEMILPNIVGTKNLPLGNETPQSFNNTSEEKILIEAKLVDYVQLIPVLVEGIKEQQTQIELLKKEIEVLKSKAANK